MASRIASANIPGSLMASIDEAAANAGLTRSAFIRWALEATIAGGRDLPTAEEHRVRLLRAGLDRDRARLADAADRAGALRPRAPREARVEVARAGSRSRSSRPG